MSLHVRALEAINGWRGTGPSIINWLYIVEGVVIVILITFYCFYWSRVAGFIAAFFLRLWLWKSSNAYFEIGAIQVSVLGGRISFNDLRYTSRNLSLRVTRGHITWRFWLWRVRSEQDRLSESRVPCRMVCSLQGAELFLYNKTPTYDAILEHLGLQDTSIKEEFVSTSSGSDHVNESSTTYLTPYPPSVPQEKKGTDWLLEALPIDIQCKTGSIVLGNPTTPNIFIFGFKSTSGSYSAAKSRSEFDLYKQVYRFTFIEPKAVWRTNPDYECSMKKRAENILSHLNSNAGFSFTELLTQPKQFLRLSTFKQWIRSLRTSKKTSNADNPPWSWKGLARYQDSQTIEEEQEKMEEYGKATDILSSPEIELTYYCDTAGKVPAGSKLNSRIQGLESVDVGNGDMSPEWGIDLVVKGGTINYGPWADRQRNQLQAVFAPAIYFDSTETSRLSPGQDRLHISLKIFVEFSEPVTMRIPTREPSKDWKYLDVDMKTTIRPYGWLDVSLGKNSTISYVMPMVSTASGYESLADIHLFNVGVTSSVNYAQFITADTCRIHASLPAPLQWKQERTWTFGIALGKPGMFLLRDHITLFTDIGKDWTTGPPGEYQTFVPFNYKLNLEMKDYALNLFVNDHNIINNPSNAEDNSLFVLSGPSLVSKVAIPSTKFCQDHTKIQFSVTASKLALSMLLPVWNTYHAFMTDNTKTFATSPELILSGSYEYYSKVAPANVERLNLYVECHDVVFKSVGYVIRHLFNLKDNYFGTFTHFVTLEEYRHRHRKHHLYPQELQHQPSQSDLFEVVLQLQLKNGLLLLPQELYDCESAVALAIPQLLVDIRNHDHYMEMMVNMEPFRVIEVPWVEELLALNFNAVFSNADSIRILGLDISANRLFGPQPRTATYICIWAVNVGKVIGSINPSLLLALSRSIDSIALGFADPDNSLPPDFNVPLDPDATFLTVEISTLDLSIRGNGTAFQIDLKDGIHIVFDDLPTPPFLKHVNIDIPSICLRFLAPLFGKAAPWMEVASVDADLSVGIGFSCSEWREKQKTQREFIIAQDSTTLRCPFIYSDESYNYHANSPFFLPKLKKPIRGKVGPISYPSKQLLPVDEDASTSDGESDSSDCYEEENDSDVKDFNFQTGDRFSAFGPILQLCERAPESSFFDRSTFRRLSQKFPQRILGSSAIPQDSTKERVKAFSDEAYSQVTDRICIDTFSERPIKVVCTPVAVQVATDVFSCVELETNPERCLDEIYIKYTESRNASPSTRNKHLELKATIPTIEVSSVQDVLRPEETITIQKHGHPINNSFKSTVLCKIQFSLDNSCLYFSSLEEYNTKDEVHHAVVTEPRIVKKASISVEKTSFQVFHPFRDQETLLSALTLQLGSFDFKILDSDKLFASLNGGQARLDFVEEAAELLIGSIWSWHSVTDIIGPLNTYSAHKRRLNQRLLWAIGRCSQNESLTSFPVFLNRVSYLVGSSANLRSDAGWKALHQSRHFWRIAKRQIMEEVNKSKEVLPEQMYLYSLQTMRTWQGGKQSTDPSIFPLLGSIYDHPDSTLPSKNTPMEVELALGGFGAFYTRDGKPSDNWLKIGPSYVLVATRAELDLPIKIGARITMSTIEANINKKLFFLIRHILKVRSTFEEKIQRFRDGLIIARTDTTSPIVMSPITPASSVAPMTVEVSFGVREISVKWQADSLECHGMIRELTLFGALGVTPENNVTVATAISLSGLTMAARDATLQELLLSVDLSDVSAVFDGQGYKEAAQRIFLLINAGALHINIPRDAIRVYEFIVKFRQSDLPDYDSLLTELRQGLDDSSHLNKINQVESSGATAFDLLGSSTITAEFILPSITFEVQAVKNLKAAYVIRDFALTFNRNASDQVECGLKLESQTVGFTTLETISKGESLNSKSFDLPALRVKSQLDGLNPSSAVIAATVESVFMEVDVSILDNLLTIQSHFGNDLEQLFQIIRPEPEAEVEKLEKAFSAPTTFKWEAIIALKGLKLALCGPKVIQWIEAESVEGHATSHSPHLEWNTRVQDLSLSLSQRADRDDLDAIRLAFFRLDLTANNKVVQLPELPLQLNKHPSHLHFKLPRIHAVFQPSGISALGDLIDHFQDEFKLRQSTRKHDVAEFRDRVTRLKSEETETITSSWISTCVVSLEVHSIGMAVPMGNQGMQSSDSLGKPPAFLASIPNLKFATQGGGAGYARIDRVALQFVPHFDPKQKEHFDGTFHSTFNQIVMPGMSSTIRPLKNGPILASFKVSGLEVDLSPSIVSYVSSLISVAQQSQDRFAKYAAMAQPVERTKKVENCIENVHIQATFEFTSGSINMHNSDEVSTLPTNVSNRKKKGSHRSGMSLGDFSFFKRFSKPQQEIDAHTSTFKLPQVSVWTEYKSIKDSNDSLIANIEIHASDNTLYPPLIGFITALSANIKAKALGPNVSSLENSIESSTIPTVEIPAAPTVTDGSWGDLAITVSLKVDQSKLKISCLPVAEITAGMAWESGGCLLSFDPSKQEVDFIVRVDEVSARLKHSFSPEDCLLAEAKGLMASFKFSRRCVQYPDFSLVSGVVNISEVVGEMNFRHFQDWLCLKSIWLDRIDLGPTAEQNAVLEKENPSPDPESSIVTIIIFEIGKVHFMCDLGQAIGKANLKATKLQSQFKLVPHESRVLAFSMNKAEAVASGRIGGNASIDAIYFATHLNDQPLRVQELLNIRLNTGHIVASVEWELHRILLVDIDPISVLATDDWSRAAPPSEELGLQFDVVLGGFNVICTVLTIPTFVGIGHQVSTLQEEKTALANSTLQKSGLSIKSKPPNQNTLSMVASRVTASSGGSNVKINLKLKIQTERLRIAVWTDNFNDGEVVRLDAGKISAQLARDVNDEQSVHRVLNLHLGFFSLRKTNHKRLTTAQERSANVSDWFELFRTSSERNIFKVPTTIVLMDSNQATGSNRLVHLFSMTFDGQVDIALNYSLLRTLGSLKTKYTEEMKRVQLNKGKAISLEPAEVTQHDPEIPTSKDLTTRTIDTDSLPTLDHEIIKMKLPIRHDDQDATLEYEAKEMVIHQPQLNLLGDATPPLEWLGLQRAKFPAWIHAGVTNTLEELLLLLSTTYEQQLARQKFAHIPSELSSYNNVKG